MLNLKPCEHVFVYAAFGVNIEKRRSPEVTWWRGQHSHPHSMTGYRSVTPSFEDEERWIAVGAIGPGSILLVVHTFYEEHDEEVIRVISARAAESHERRAYEEAHKGAEARHPSDRRKKRRRH